MVEFDHACAHAVILYHKATELLVKDLDLNLNSAIKMDVQVKVSLQRWYGQKDFVLNAPCLANRVLYDEEILYG